MDYLPPANFPHLHLTPAVSYSNYYGEFRFFVSKCFQAVSTLPNYTVTVTPDTAGRYICQAVVQGFPEVSAEAVILLKGPPKILSQRIQFGSQGETVRLECLAIAIPRPDRVTWSHAGREIDFRKFKSTQVGEKCGKNLRMGTVPRSLRPIGCHV